MKEKEAQHAAEKQERVLAAFQKLLENVWGERSRLTQSGMTATKKDLIATTLDRQKNNLAAQVAALNQKCGRRADDHHFGRQRTKCGLDGLINS
jgi:hypothetical protein